jgi:hypothetical protein
MERTDVSKYINKFSVELKNFLIFLDELIPTEIVQNILGKYDELDTLKLMEKYRRNILKFKDKLAERDATIFKTTLYIIPEVDISFYWNNLQQTHRNTIAEKLLRLIVCSNVIVEKMTPQKYQPSVKQMEQPTPHNPQVERNLFNGVGEDNTDISVETFTHETETAQLDGNPLLNKLEDYLNVDQISEQLNKIDGESMNKIVDDIGKFIDPHVQNPEVKTSLKNAMCNIIDKFKTHDLKTEGLFDVISQVSNEMAHKLTSDTQNSECPPEHLLESAHSILKSLGVDKNINPEKLNPSSLMSMASKLINSIQQNDTQNPSHESNPETTQNTTSSAVAMMDLAGKLLGL